VPDRLPVHVNREQLHSLEVPPSFETSDSFVVEVRNHGEAGRVHLHLDGDLADIATLEANNYYVEANATQEIPVSVHHHRDAFGKLKVVSGYGATTRWVDVELSEPDDAGSVVVDEDLGKPGGGDGPAEPRDGERRTESPLADVPGLPVLGLGAVAVLVAVAAALYFQSAVVAVAAGVVLVAVLAALALAFA